MTEQGERWYRFDQVEVMRRAFWVRAPSLAAAREHVRNDRAGLDGVPDYASNNPDSIRIVGRGRLEPEQLLVDHRAQDLEDVRF